jgi:hypothetical protein
VQAAAAALPDRDHEPRVLQDAEVLHDGHPAHVEPGGDLPHRRAGLRHEEVEDRPAAPVGEGPEGAVGGAGIEHVT